MGDKTRKNEFPDAGPSTAPLRSSLGLAPTTPRLLRRLIRSFARPAATPLAQDAADGQRALVLCHALLAERGEASAARLAGEALAACTSLRNAGIDAFFDGLVDEFSPDTEHVLLAVDAYRADTSQTNLMRLQTVVESPRQELFRRFNMVPGGTAALVDLRRQLLPTLSEHPQRAGVDADLVHLFRSWFNRGFLMLQRIDWRTSALVLERLIQYEAVHQIQGWRDLRRRLESDRRCYAFFHPALPDEPLIFIEVALTKGMAASVQPLIDAEAPVADPAQADCAMFYSITNCQVGLRGVSFGNFLIKQAVEDLRREFRRLRTFATLSPLPGFVRWLTTSRVARSPELENLVRHVNPGNLSPEVPHQRDERRSDATPVLRVSDSLQREVTALCVRYLLRVKRGTVPLDPVARFHLANGARLERLNWMGDTSTNGLQQSLGLTVNYAYRLAEVERNHESFAKAGAIATSREIEAIARKLVFT